MKSDCFETADSKSHLFFHAFQRSRSKPSPVKREDHWKANSEDGSDDEDQMRTMHHSRRKRVGKKVGNPKCAENAKSISDLARLMGQVQRDHWIIRDSLANKETECNDTKRVLVRISAERDILTKKVNSVFSGKFMR